MLTLISWLCHGDSSKFWWVSTNGSKFGLKPNLTLRCDLQGLIGFWLYSFLLGPDFSGFSFSMQACLCSSTWRGANVKHTQLGELVLQQSQDCSNEGRAEAHKQDRSIGSRGAQVLEDEVESHVDSIYSDLLAL